jgi:hypothetical protein
MRIFLFCRSPTPLQNYISLPLFSISNAIFSPSGQSIASIFAAQNVMTASPLGSPTAESPKVTPALNLTEWMILHGPSNIKHNGRRIKAVPQSQIALPF